MNTIESLWKEAELIAKSGASILLKIDGGRIEDNPPRIYSVVITGGNLKDDYFREDSVSIESALSNGIQFYKQKTQD